MEASSLLRIWASNDYPRLLKLATDMNGQGSWHAYLSVQEHSLFEYAISHGEWLWSKFLDGNVVCQVERHEPTPEIPSNGHNGRVALVNRDSSNGPRAEASQEPDPSDGDHNDATRRSVAATGSITTVDSLVLAFRVRYMLFDKFSSLLFPALARSSTVDSLASLFDDAERATAANGSAANDTNVKRQEEDDYDDDEDEDNGHDEAPSSTNGNPVDEAAQLPKDDLGRPIIRVTIDTDENLSRTNKETVSNLNRMYHTFENDRDNALKQRKLEESDRQMDSDILESTTTPNKMTSTAAFGAANLSLKHLLATIESRRDQLSLTETELQNLISDVRKNRSKWASEDKVGQEELYEAAEKAVLELRGYTEHSTAFLNKVNKRDAPNYFTIIKHPMDLNTVMKKLKGFQYKSKKEFVDDLMLIWQNCLTYNTDPRHFLRAHAIAMQRKTLSLIPLIPDIEIRDRAEVEAEETRAEKEANDANTTAADSDDEGTSSAGLGAGLGRGGKHATKGRKRKLDNIEDEESGDVTANDDSVVKAASPSVSEVGQGAAGDSHTPSISRASPFPRIDRVSTPTPGPDIDSELNETLKEEGREPAYEPDVEFQLWQNLSSKQRAHYWMQRSELFQNDKLQPDAPASLRNGWSMAKFEDEVGAMLKPDPEEESRARLFMNRSLADSFDGDGHPFLLEYEVASGVPPVYESMSRYKLFDGDDDDDDDDEELGYARNLTAGDIPQSRFVVHTGLAPKITSNLEEIQKIRKVCSKIALIRQMQQQQHMHVSLVDPYAPPKIEELDLDVGSRLPNRDPYDEGVAAGAMRRAVSKLSMHNGFEVTELMAVDTLTEIAGEYLVKLGRTLVCYLDDYSESMSTEDMVVTALRQQGIEDLLSLESYVRDDIERHGTKLQDLTRKLTGFMTDLLRPGFAELSDRQFGDDSDQFLNGDFSMELGDDFFGFRELGLDREFGLLTSSVPFHLLHSKLNASFNNETDMPVYTERSHQVPDYSPVDSHIAQSQIGLLRSFFLSKLDGSHQDILPEGDQVPPKQRNSRSKLPPTGKIPGVKKKAMSKVFFRPERPIEQSTQEDSQKFQGDLLGGAIDVDAMTFDDSVDSLF